MFERLGLSAFVDQPDTGVWIEDEYEISSDITPELYVALSGIESLSETNQPDAIAARIERAPGLNRFSQLFKKLVDSLSKETNMDSRRLYINLDGSEIHVHPALKDVHLIIKPTSQAFTNVFGKERAKLFDISQKTDRFFMSEALALSSLIDELKNQRDLTANLRAFAVFGSLNYISRRYGIQSTKYKTACSIMVEKLQDWAAIGKFHFALISDNSISMTDALHKRQIDFDDESNFEDEEMINSRPSGNIWPLGTCYPNEASCGNHTNGCSGHGHCSPYMGDDTCWTCACTPTVNTTEDGGILTTVWVGESCQKQDISLQFQLFFWFLVASIFTLVWAIKLLYRVGQEDMGGILTSTVSPK